MKAPRKRVWSMLTDAEQFAKWFGVKITGTFAPGARVEMTTTDEEHAGIRFFVVIDKMEPERLFSWRWHPGMPRPDVDYSKEPMTRVTFTLEDAENGTKVTVVESGFDEISLTRRAAVYQDNTKGWEFQMKSLARHVGEA